MVKRVYEQLKDFTLQVCRGLQKIIGYEPLSKGSIIVCRSPEDSRELVYFPTQFPKRMFEIYGTSQQNHHQDS